MTGMWNTSWIKGREWTQPLLWSGLGIVVLLCYFGVNQNTVYLCDECYHGPRIGYFLEGDFSRKGDLAMLWGYHTIIAIIMALIGGESVEAARTISLMGATLVPVLVYFLSLKRGEGAEAQMKAAIVICLPMVFTLMFYLYTDVWSMGAHLAMMLLLFSGKHKWAAVVAVLAILIRQTNMIWVLYAAVLVGLIFWKDMLQKYDLWKRRNEVIGKIWPYALVLMGFVFFVLWNGGVAHGDRENQSSVLNPTNLPYLLVSIGVLFWPIVIDEIARRRPTRDEIIKWCAIWLCFMGISWVFRHSEHPYNGAGVYFYIHNHLLYFWADHPGGRCMAAFALGVTTIFLCRGRYTMNPYGWLYVISILSVVCMPVVDSRYQMSTLAMLIILRQMRCSVLAYANIVWLLGLSLIIMSYMLNYTAIL
ncbi:MAG: hypothetical protein AAGH72_12255 [Verrucomicrobiota bacterium]